MADVKVPTPTVDLNALYAKSDQKLLSDFVRVQKLLSDPDTPASGQNATTYLALLNEELAKQQPGPLAGQSETDKAVEANRLLDNVLSDFEQRCGFQSERPVLVGFASGEDFRTLTGERRHFYDVGAGGTHGEMTHRIQWFLVMADVTGGTFDNHNDSGYAHTVLDLFAASLSEDYEVPSNSAGKKSYMWDWLVDRTRDIVLYPTTAAQRTITYEADSDRWTNPGDELKNGPGPLTNDILLDAAKRAGNENLDKLKEIRNAQVAGNGPYNDKLRAWFKVAVDLEVAEGRALMENPETGWFTYFYMPSDEMLDVLRTQRKTATDLVAELRGWAATAAKPADADALTKRVVEAQKDAFLRLAPLLEASPKQRLAQAILNTWFAPIVRSVGGAALVQQAEFKEAVAAVVQACDAVMGSPAAALL